MSRIATTSELQTNRSSPFVERTREARWIPVFVSSHAKSDSIG